MIFLQNKMKNNENNLVFVSGPHGAGKSTLVSYLLENIPNSFSPKLKTRTPQFYWGGAEDLVEMNHFHRQTLKTAQRATENYEYWIASKANPDKIIIGDRCIYDARVYREVYVSLGWVTPEQADTIKSFEKYFYPEEILNPYSIVLNPGIDVCRQHLETRWKETGWIKFKETDFNYLETVCKCFATLEENKNIFYIDHEFDFSNERVLDSLIDWLKIKS